MTAYFHIPYRQTQGVVRGRAKSKVPSIRHYSTIERRIKELENGTLTDGMKEKVISKYT
jgi:hypothetical protein